MPSPDVVQHQISTFYADHRAWLFNWLRRRLGNVCQAEDLTHDTFLRLLMRPQAIDSQRSPRGYLATIAHGLLVDHWRREEIERAWLETLAVHADAAAPSAEYVAAVVQSLMEIDRMLGTLPEKPRQAFLMVQLHGMRYAEIAHALEVSERMVKKYMAQVMLHCLTLNRALPGDKPA